MKERQDAERPNSEVDLGQASSRPHALDYAGVRRLPAEDLNRRQIAFAFDTVVWHGLGALCFHASGLVEFLRNNFSPLGYSLLAGSLLVGWRFLFLMKDGIHGCSPGKWLMDLRVVTMEGQPIGPGESIKRNLLFLIPFVGELIAWAQTRLGRPRWFDAWAKCRVISIE